MRSRDGSTRFCVIHDPHPGSVASSGNFRLPIQPALLCIPNTRRVAPALISRNSSHSRASTQHSRSSTPPTPLSNGPASETFTIPPPSEETIRRREQSDLAARLIAQKMLQGYAMLGDECPSPECIGVPLVRPPKRGGGKSSAKVCRSLVPHYEEPKNVLLGMCHLWDGLQ